MTTSIYPKTDAQSVSGTPTDTITYGYDTVWTDKMTSYDGTAITYDACGNPLSYRGKNLVWIKDNQLFDVSWDGNEYAYTYNHDGIPVGKLDYSTYAQTIYQLTDGLIAAEKRTDGSGAITAQMVYTYDSNDTIIAMRYNGVQYYYMKNGQGDIIGIVDDSGNVVVEYSYDSWGKVLSVTGNTTLGNANPFRYRGYYYDTETGFYYLYGRYYDPEVGRFINADDTELLTESMTAMTDKNLFAYCDNNPISRMDESGNMWQLAIAGGSVLSTGMGMSLGTIGSSIITGLGAITPAGWVALGTIAIIGTVALGITYAKTKAKNNSKSKSKTQSQTKERVNSPIGRRKHYNSRKAAKEAAQRAGKGKSPVNHYKYSHGNKNAHFHPNVKNNYRITPHSPSSHDHYYYPR